MHESKASHEPGLDASPRSCVVCAANTGALHLTADTNIACEKKNGENFRLPHPARHLKELASVLRSQT